MLNESAVNCLETEVSILLYMHCSRNNSRFSIVGIWYHNWWPLKVHRMRTKECIRHLLTDWVEHGNITHDAVISCEKLWNTVTNYHCHLFGFSLNLNLQRKRWASCRCLESDKTNIDLLGIANLPRMGTLDLTQSEFTFDAINFDINDIWLRSVVNFFQSAELLSTYIHPSFVSTSRQEIHYSLSSAVDIHYKSNDLW